MGLLIKKIELRTIDQCDTCHKAIDELAPLAKENNIPIVIRNPLDSDELMPVVCFVEENGEGSQKKTCFEGYTQETHELAKLFIKK